MSQDSAPNVDLQQQTTEPASSSPQKLEGEELKEAIKKQIEFYFSRHNLSNDPYLVAHMSKDMYVSIEVVASFKAMKALTEDVNLIIDAVKSSQQVALDETSTKIRPNFSVTRNTVILRDIPVSTPVEDVKRLFASDNQPKEVKSDIGDTWYTSFDTEQQALDALEHLRKQTFNGKAVSARIKSENILKSFYAPNQTSIPTNTQGVPIYGGYVPKAGGYNNNNNYYGGAYQGAYDPNYGRFAPRGRGGYRGGRGGSRRPPTGAPGAATTTGTPATYYGKTRQDGAAYISGAAPQQYGGKKQLSRRPRGAPKPPPNFTTESFPPLPTISKADLGSGYKEEFLKYSKQSIIETFNGLSSNLTRPEGIPENCTAVLQTPIAQLELTKPLPESNASAATTAEPISSESSTSTPSTPSSSSPAVSSIGKSFAEVAITAKDIKTPDIKRDVIVTARKDSLKGRSRSNSTEQSDKPATANNIGVNSSNKKAPRKSNKKESNDSKKSGQQKQKKTYVEAEPTENSNNTYAAVVSKSKPKEEPVTPSHAATEPAKPAAEATTQ